MKKILSFLMLTLLTAGFSAKAEDQVYAVWNNSTTTLTLYYDDRCEAQGGKTDWWTYATIQKNATTVVLDESMKAARPTSTANWFYVFNKLSEIRNLDYLNTSEVTEMHSMFYDCKLLTSLDLSSFNTYKVTAMSWMFYYCQSLTSLNLGSFYTDKVTTMRSMFDGCSALTTIYWNEDLSERTGLNSTDMFKGCTSLKGGNGTEYNSGKTDASYALLDGKNGKNGYFTYKLMEAYTVFDGYNTLTYYYDDKRAKHTGDGVVTELYEPENGHDQNRFAEYADKVRKAVIDKSFKNAKLTSLANMFDGNDYNLIILEEIEGLDNIDFSEVTDMYAMFYGCASLTAIDLSSFKTDKVTDMAYMFRNCSSIDFLNFTSFNIGKVENMNAMFMNCSALKTICCNTDWSVSLALTSSLQMFDGCTALEGGNRTKYDAAHTNVTYARPDGVDDKPGYFTSYHAFEVKSEMNDILLDLHALYDFAVLYIPEEELADIKSGMDNFDNIYNTETVAKIESNLALAGMLRSTAINTLKTDGMEALKDLLDSKLMLGDNPACEDIIKDAKSKIDALTWDDLKSVTDNLAIIAPAVKKILDDADEALLEDRMKGADALKVELNGYIQDLNLLYDLAKQYIAETELASLKSSIETYEATYNNPKATAFMVYSDNMAASMTVDDAINQLMTDGKTALKTTLEGLLQTGDNDNCQNIIKNAKDAIDALAWDYEKTVTDNIAILENAIKQILDDAEKALVAERDAAEKEAADKKAAKEVDDLIAAIGTVEYTDASKALIDAARTAYDALTTDQKTFVTTLATLEAAEKAYADLKAAAETATGTDDVRSDKVQGTKFIRNGILYIEYNGTTYTLRGARLD